MPLGLKDERKLLSVVEADPAARGIVSTVLRDVYLARTRSKRPPRSSGPIRRRSFVTPEGVLVGPAVIHTAKEADARAREIRAELQVVAHDLSATLQRPQAEAGAPRGDRGRDRLPARADRRAPTRRSPRRRSASACSSATSAACARRRSSSSSGSPRSTRPSAAARDRLTALGPLSAEPMPDLPPTPQPPIQHRVTVETLRRDRGSLDGKLHSLRAERDVLAAHDPVQLRAEVEAAERARADAESAVARADEAAAAAAEARDRPPRPSAPRPSARPPSTRRGATRPPSSTGSVSATRRRTARAATSSGGSARPSGCSARATRPTPTSSSLRSATTTRSRRSRSARSSSSGGSACSAG